MRRLLLVVIGVLWLTNGALLAWVKLSKSQVSASDKQKLVVYCAKKEQAKKVAKSLESLGLKVEVLQGQTWKREVKEGFLVINRVSDADVRPSVLAGMKSKLPVKLVDEDIRLGGVYKTKAEANKAAANAQSKGFTFQVVDNVVEKTVKVESVEAILQNKEQAGQAVQALTKISVAENQIVLGSIDTAAPQASVTPTPTP